MPVSITVGCNSVGTDLANRKPLEVAGPGYRNRVDLPSMVEMRKLVGDGRTSS